MAEDMITDDRMTDDRATDDVGADAVPGPLGTVAAALLLAGAFGAGGLFGAVVMAALLRLDRTRPGPAPTESAVAAAVLLALAAVFSVLVGAPSATELTPSFAGDRGLAAAAALAASICTLFATVALARRERSVARRRLQPIGRLELTGTALAVVGGLVLLAAAAAVRAALGPEPLRADFTELVTNLRVGHGYARGVAPTLDATALHPPLAPLLAAILPGAVEHLHVVVSSVAVLATAALGGRVGGVRGAVTAGLMAALLPSMWGQQLPEALAALGVAAALALAWPDRASVPTAALAGVCLAGAALARPEAIVAVPVVVGWMALRSRWSAAPVIACGLTAAALIAPWLVWTQDRFGVLAPSTSLGATIAGANTSAVDSGTRMGELDPLPPPPPGTDEGFLDGERRRAGFERFWSARTPLVVAARIGRAWDVWSPGSVRAARDARGLTTPGGGAGVVVEAVASAVFVAWLVARRRDWRRLMPFYALPVAFTLISAVTFGSRDLRSWTAPLVAVALGLFLAELGRRPASAPPRPSL